MTIEKIKEEVQNWDKAQQTDLVHYLIELISNDKYQLPENWKKEIDRRMDNYEKGVTVGIPAREVLAQYLKK